MRVIAGAQRGRLLLGPQRRGLRPTPNQVREALFSILGPRVAGSRFADLFAGTGAIGIEALSRGAAEAVFVESDSTAVQLIRTNLGRCGMESRGTVCGMPVSTFLARGGPHGPFDIVFADPPYQRESGLELLSSLATGATIAAHSLVILEHFVKAPAPSQAGQLYRLREYRYGDTVLSLFSPRTEGASAL